MLFLKFWKFQKTHEQLLLKDIKKPEALSETVQKMYDLKKASVGKIHQGIRRYYLKHQQNGHSYLITLM